MKSMKPKKPVDQMKETELEQVSGGDHTIKDFLEYYKSEDAERVRTCRHLNTERLDGNAKKCKDCGLIVGV